MEPISMPRADLDRRCLRSATWTDQRSTVPRAAESTRLIHTGRALDLPATAVTQRGKHDIRPPISMSPGRYAHSAHGELQRIVHRARSSAQVGDDDLEELREHGVRELYGQGPLCVRLTLGALAVLEAAESSQDRGDAWPDALYCARSVAAPFLDALPDPALGATRDAITTAQPEFDGAPS
jgi:hypothetical protein